MYKHSTLHTCCTCGQRAHVYETLIMYNILTCFTGRLHVHMYTIQQKYSTLTHALVQQKPQNSTRYTVHTYIMMTGQTIQVPIVKTQVSMSHAPIHPYTHTNTQQCPLAVYSHRWVPILTNTDTTCPHDKAAIRYTQGSNELASERR